MKNKGRKKIKRRDKVRRDGVEYILKFEIFNTS